MSALKSLVQFVNDDRGYLRWVVVNPSGFVVNSNRVPASNYLILHRATCKHITNPERTNWTTTGYIKTCSTDLAALDNWADRTTGGVLSPCGHCKPVEQVTKDQELPPARTMQIAENPPSSLGAR